MAEKVATALRYDTTVPAPFVLARGRNHLAERLINIAREAGIPVQYDSELAERLLWLEPGEVIPQELYQPVAEILSFMLELKKMDVAEKNEENSG